MIIERAKGFLAGRNLKLKVYRKNRAMILTEDSYIKYMITLLLWASFPPRQKCAREDGCFDGDY